MDNPDAPETKRPLSTPGASVNQRPSTPVLSSSPVPASSFYATQKPPPPLPIRPKYSGSGHTAVPPHDPPRYGSHTFNISKGFQETELVLDDSIPEDDNTVPDLIPHEDYILRGQNIKNPYDLEGHWSSDGNRWSKGSDWSHVLNQSWASGSASQGLELDKLDYTNRTDQNFMIDGRVDNEEINWWDPNEREKCNRPGPGILSPVLADELHDPDHSLFSINVVSPPVFTVLFHATPSTSDRPTVTAPTVDEIRMAVPHPDAFYCPKDNAWVILSWKSSSVTPLLARSFVNSPNAVHDQASTGSCIEEDQPFGKMNKTHHFHKYEKAVDSHKLTPPFRQDEWQNIEPMEKKTGDDEGKLLDLYVCCQCSFYCVASGVIPGVIPRKYIDEVIRDKRSNPSVGKTGDQAVVCALETFTVAIGNKLWRGNDRMIKVSSSGFQMKVGWTSTIKRIFDILGFVEETTDWERTLRPPITDNTVQGKQNRCKLLRAWVEIHAWLADFKRLHASQFKDTKDKSPVRLDSAREMYQTAIGAHPDQVPRGGLSDSMLDALQPLEAFWKGLGLTPTTYSPDLLAFAYLAQCRCDPAGTPRYFTYLSNILRTLQGYGSCPVPLQELLAMEQSRGRFTLEDVDTAAGTLGFGADNVLGVDYDDKIPDDFVENTWRDSVKRSWRDPEYGSEMRRLTNEAFKILAETRGSVKLRKTWENKYMIHNLNPDQAYNTLETPKDVDDYILITMYKKRLEETLLQIEKMREAMTVITEVRDSERLRQFLSSGQDPGGVVMPIRPDLPRGSIN